MVRAAPRLSASGRRLILRLAFAVALMITASSCAVPTGEYRGGLYLHQAPTYSFRIADGWRRAETNDYPDFGFNKRVRQKFNEAAFRAFGEQDLALQDAVLISTRGAWLQINSGKNDTDLRVPRGYRLSDGEKRAVWDAVSTKLINSAPANDKPRLTLTSIDVTDHDPLTAIRIRYVSDVQRGVMHWSFYIFYGTSHWVSFGHVGIPEDALEGLPGVEAMVRSFRWD